jgi:putative endonuclease
MEYIMYWVYILKNSKERFYVGQTANLDQRIEQHNQSCPLKGKYTLKNGPWNLVWFEQHPTRSSAMIREKQIKSMKSARWIRERLLNTLNQAGHGAPGLTAMS